MNPIFSYQNTTHLVISVKAVHCPGHPGKPAENSLWHNEPMNATIIYNSWERMRRMRKLGADAAIIMAVLFRSTGACTL
jgi:hypothetical protein